MSAAKLIEYSNILQTVKLAKNNNKNSTSVCWMLRTFLQDVMRVMSGFIVCNLAPKLHSQPKNRQKIKICSLSWKNNILIQQQYIKNRKWTVPVHKTLKNPPSLNFPSNYFSAEIKFAQNSLTTLQIVISYC